MTVTSTPSRIGIPLMGGVGPAKAAVEALTRNLSAELVPQGIRVVGLRPHGMPESGTIKEVFGLHAKAWGISWDQFHELIASRTHGRRLPTLVEMANVAAFIASDQASAMTGTVVNMSLGSLDDQHLLGSVGVVVPLLVALSWGDRQLSGSPEYRDDRDSRARRRDLEIQASSGLICSLMSPSCLPARAVI